MQRFRCDRLDALKVRDVTSTMYYLLLSITPITRSLVIIQNFIKDY